MNSPVELDSRLLEWLKSQLGNEFSVVRVRPLIGGLSAVMRHVTLRDGTLGDGTLGDGTLGDGGRDLDIVVRQYPDADEWRLGHFRREVDGLPALAASGLPIPQLLASDDGTATGSLTTVTSFLSGTPLLQPKNAHDWVCQIAEVLVAIHAVTEVAVQPCQMWEPADPDWIADSALARDALALCGVSSGDPQTVLAHGDFQHFNLLWHNQRLTGVVDWTGVGLGPRGFDVGHCRLNLAVLYSPELAMRFLDHYQRLSGVVVDPAVDVQRLLCFGTNWPEFIHVQVAGRAPVDTAGMAARVSETIRQTLRRVG